MGQTRLLSRAFFGRLFESELMPDGLPQVQLVVWGVLLAATPATAYALMLPKKYQGAQFFIPLGPEFDADRMILITLSMIAIGVVGLVIWDGVFPDKRDVRILGPLPIPTHRLVIARLGALGRVYVLFAAPLCASQSVIFGLTVSGFGAPVSRIQGIGAHFVTVSLACAFVFTALIAAQCVLLLLFGKRAAQAASVAFQLLFAVGLVQLLFFLPYLGRLLRQGGASHEGLSALAAVPPIWFFAVYQQLSGFGDAGSAALARIGTGATLLTVVLAPAAYALSYRRLSQRALEGPAPRGAGTERSRMAQSGSGLFRRGFNAPVPMAIRHFTVRTLVRSRSHRMMVAVYLGFAIAFVLSSVISIVIRYSSGALARPDIAMLSMPLLVQFLMLVGIRAIVAVPSEPKARWVFRACEPADRPAAVSGTRDTMMQLVVLPTTALALLQGLLFWDLSATVSHAAFCLVMGRLLAELLVPRTGKLPFACTYYPGKSRIFTLWPLYLVAFFTYSVALAEIDRVLTTRPAKLAWVCAGATLVAHGIVIYRRRVLGALTALRFEEEDPDAIFQGFQLSEGLAAAPRAPGLDPAARAAPNVAP